MVAIAWSLVVVPSVCGAALLTLGALTLVHMHRLVRTMDARMRAMEEVISSQSAQGVRVYQLEQEKDRLNHERALLAHAIGADGAEHLSPEGADVDHGRLGAMQDNALTEWAQRHAHSVSRDNSAHGGGVWPDVLKRVAEERTKTDSPVRFKRTSGACWSPVEKPRKGPNRRAEVSDAVPLSPLFTDTGQLGGTHNASHDDDCVACNGMPNDSLDSLDRSFAGPSVVSVDSLASSRTGAALQLTTHEAATVDITRAPAPPATLRSVMSVPVDALGTSDAWLPRVRTALLSERDDSGAWWSSWRFGSRAASMV